MMKFANRMIIRTAAWLLLAIPAPLFAWGVDGHQIVCLIAEDNLTPASKAMIHDLLGANVNISDAEIANWADQNRREDKDTGPWHFVDIPASARVFDEARDGQNGNNVIDKVTEFAKIVRDTTKSKADRAQALKYLVHFVGDAHQPLHCVDRDGDKGGNTRLVFVPGKSKATNLHSAWDSVILIEMRGVIPIARYADGLNAKITKAKLAEWQKGTPTDWANESHQLAVKVAYNGIPENGPPPRLNADYLHDSALCIIEQLQKGGVRLAMVLNQLSGS